MIRRGKMKLNTNSLTGSNKYNIIRFASGRFYLWINNNLCESISGKCESESFFFFWKNLSNYYLLWFEERDALTLYWFEWKLVGQRMLEHFHPWANVFWWNSMLHRVMCANHCDMILGADLEPILIKMERNWSTLVWLNDLRWNECCSSFFFAVIFSGMKTLVKIWSN